MLLRKASKLLVGDMIDVDGRWCVESIGMSDDSRFILLVLSNRQQVADPDAIAPPVQIKRMTVRRRDYLSIDTSHMLRDSKSE